MTEDTPVLVRNPNGNIEIKQIDDLTTSYICVNDRECGTTDYEVWSDQSWTRIKNVVRHRVQKQMYRILTHTGCVDVTEDHSLLRSNKSEVRPRDCSIGDKLLHSYPNFVNVPDAVTDMSLIPIACRLGIQYKTVVGRTRLRSLIQDCPQRYVQQTSLNCSSQISKDEAWVMGFFWADGYCGIHTKTFQSQRKLLTERIWCLEISNMDLLLLNRAKEIFEKQYGKEGVEFVLSKPIEKKKTDPVTGETSIYGLLYKIRAKGGKKIESLVTSYRSLFYDSNKRKRIPACILNASTEVREQFVRGYSQVMDVNTISTRRICEQTLMER